MGWCVKDIQPTEKEVFVGLIRKALAPLLTDEFIARMNKNRDIEIIEILSELKDTIASEHDDVTINISSLDKLIDKIDGFASSNVELTKAIKSQPKTVDIAGLDDIRNELIKVADEIKVSVEFTKAQAKEVALPAEVRVANLDEINLAQTQAIFSAKFPYKPSDGGGNTAIQLVRSPHGTDALPVSNPDGSNIGGGLIPDSYDYISIPSYDANSNPLTVVYKKGGAAGSTVATLTLTYDGSGNVSTVTRT